jgi:hypothetical protein
MNISATYMTVSSGNRVTRSLVLCEYYIDRCPFVLFYFDHGVHIRILITLLASSSSYFLYW